MNPLAGGQQDMGRSKLLLETGGEVGEVDGLPAHGSEIVINDGPHAGTYVVLRHRWHVSEGASGNVAVVVRPAKIGLC